MINQARIAHMKTGKTNYEIYGGGAVHGLKLWTSWTAFNSLNCADFYFSPNFCKRATDDPWKMGGRRLVSAAATAQNRLRKTGKENWAESASSQLGNYPSQFLLLLGMKCVVARSLWKKITTEQMSGDRELFTLARELWLCLWQIHKCKRACRNVTWLVKYALTAPWPTA